MSYHVTDSRFYMWRTIFALVHADHQVTSEEHAFAAHYLDSVPFTSEQRKILADDLKSPQNVIDMFDRISNPEDRGEFFEFARNLLAVDNDFSEAEKKIFEILVTRNSAHFNTEALRQEIARAHDDSIARREAEDLQFAEEADQITGFIRGMKG